MQNIIFVKKILANGEACQKCRQVSERLEADGLLSRVNQILIADENDPQSPGMVLAQKYAVSRAPFFVVETDETVEVFDVYFAFKKFLST